RRYWLHPGTPAPAPISVAEFLVSFAWTVFPWPSALLTEAVWPARPSSVTSFRPSPSAASPFSPASRTPSPAFTMADLRVHDDRSSRSRWPDLRVHDGPKFARTLVWTRAQTCSLRLRARQGAFAPPPLRSGPSGDGFSAAA